MKTKPVLYQKYSRSEIDASFRRGAPDVVIADAFLVGPNAVVALADTSGVDAVFTFSAPGQLIWSPKHGTAAATEMVKGRIPEPLEQTFLSPTSRRWLFASNNGSDFEFVGKMELSYVGLRSMADRGPDAQRAAFFHITPRLSLDAWSRFGEFSGWRLSVNGRTKFLPTDADIEQAVTPEWREDVFEVYLTRYEGDCFHLVANGDWALFAYSDEARGIGMSSRNANYKGKARAVTHLTGFDNADWDTLTRDIISKDEALQLLKTFFRTGRPTGLAE